MMGADEAFQVTVADDGEDTKRVSGDQKIGLCQLNRIIGEKRGVPTQTDFEHHVAY